MIPKPVEVELKYLVPDPPTAAWLLEAPAFGPFSAGPPSPAVPHEDRYLDSPDGALGRAGYAGRIRRTPGAIVVTLKSTATSTGALQRREELEADGADSLDPRDWPASTPRSLVLELCVERPLVELATIRQRRTSRELMADDAAVELSVDEVEVVAAGEVVDRFTEVEAELRSGREERLRDLSDVLDAHGLVAAGGSKLERARHALARRADRAADDGQGEGGPR
jgi:triphosphatase